MELDVLFGPKIVEWLHLLVSVNM